MLHEHAIEKKVGDASDDPMTDRTLMSSSAFLGPFYERLCEDVWNQDPKECFCRARLQTLCVEWKDDVDMIQKITYSLANLKLANQAAF
eukprot:CAMPEP_0179009942 /NCGR_PEP_ID=MMETSP0795-20121207/16539_1 /TAXON_ID=88552 /ORGANISM="Amoebophrya sp., Strain Ameob2" /LENGTH=88 /DNA_ID=CAMNT_0020705169 /DNA_START=645 /DNA_END=911 /DNA_ORIENTATION=+